MQFLIDGKGGEFKRQWLVDTGDAGKINEELYIASEKFKEQVYVICTNRNECSIQTSGNGNEAIRNEAITYLAALARGILRAFINPSYDTGIEIDSQHINFNASLCVGIWSDLNESWSK